MSNEAPNFTFGKAVHSAETPIEAVVEMMADGIVALTIKQVAALTGLTAVYIRRRTQEGTFSKDYDERGRVLIPAAEVEEYLRKRAERAGKAYIVRLTDGEVLHFKAAFPGKTLTPRYDPKAAKAYRQRKAATAQHRGTTQGRLHLP